MTVLYPNLCYYNEVILKGMPCILVKCGNVPNFLTLFLFLFSNKMLLFRTETHKRLPE